MVFNLNVTRNSTGGLPNWKVDYTLPYTCNEPPSIADVNGDGNVEIIQACTNNVTIYSNTYEILWTIPMENPRAFVIAQDLDNDGLIELVFTSGLYDTGSSAYVYDTVTPAPTPRALSQFTFYSPHRDRVPYYTAYGPYVPIVKTEIPTNKASNQVLNPLLSIYIYDYQQDRMDVTFRTNASTGVWHTINSYANVAYGTYTATPMDMNSYTTKYWWSVNRTDNNGHWTNKTFNFSTGMGSTEQWWDDNWRYRKHIHINHNLVVSELTNFPVLISLNSDTDLAAHAQDDGDDIVFIHK